MDWMRFSVAGLIIAIATLACLVAPPVLVIVSGGCFAYFLVALSPASSQWQNGEFATTVVWLFGAILAFSNVKFDGLAFLFFLVGGVVLVISWGFREAIRKSKPASLIAWANLLFVPASLLLGVALAVTDLDLRLRLAGSESAFRADVKRVAIYPKEVLKKQERRVGLFWIRKVEESQGSVIWTTGGVFMNYHGLAYIPDGLPKDSSYDFWHIRGPWWGFEFDF